MDLGLNSETASSAGFLAGLGALVNSLWDKWCARQTKKEMYRRMDEMGDEIVAHAVYDAKNYMEKPEIEKLVDRIEKKIDKLQQMIISLMEKKNIG